MQYFKRLKAHPGVPVAAAFTLVFILAGLSNKSLGLLGGVMIGLLTSSPYWAIVLWTVRTQPLP